MLILDEPTSALDVSVQAQIMNLLKDLKEDPGISMLFITHDIGLASDLCDRIAVAYAGEQMEFGPAERVLVAPHHPTPSSSWRRCRASIRTSRPGRCPATRPTSPRCPRVPLPPSLSRTPWKPVSNHPPPIPLPDGGHARCWLNDPVVAGERYEIQLRPTEATRD